MHVFIVPESAREPSIGDEFRMGQICPRKFLGVTFQMPQSI